MNKISYILLLFIFMKSQIFAQSPNWSVDETKFQYNMTIVGFSNINGVELHSVNDKVAAFVGAECRGVTKFTYVESEDAYFAYLTLFATRDDEQITFKVYNSGTNEIVPIEETLTFKTNSHKGNIFTPYSISSPKLKSESNILSLSLDGVAGVVNRETKKVTVELNPSYNPESVTLNFTLSDGAKAFVDEVLLVNNTEGLDFSSEKEITIVSQDKSVAQNWRVNVVTNTGAATFYRKDAVCYAKGLIKVDFPTNNTPVVLKKDGAVLKTQSIADGTTIFTELEVGTYVVEVNGTTKEIIIRLKV